MITDARGAELFVGDLIGTVTGGRNAMVITGTVAAIHEVKITIEVISCEFVGEPVGRYHPHKAEPGDKKQLNAYRVFRLGPCVHEQEDQFALDNKDLRIEVYRAAIHGQPVTVKVTHLPTGCTFTETHMFGLTAKANALTGLARAIKNYQEPR